MKSCVMCMSGVMTGRAVSQGFDTKELLYNDYARLPADKEKAINARYVDTVEELVRCVMTSWQMWDAMRSSLQPTHAHASADTAGACAIGDTGDVASPCRVVMSPALGPSPGMRNIESGCPCATL